MAGVDRAFVDFVSERMAFVRGFATRRMFGGVGLFADGRMFAIVIGDALYFKADAEVRPAYEAKGAAPFAYAARGRQVTLQYYAAPSEVFDDPDAMREWVAWAVGAALRSASLTKRPVAPRSRRKPGA